MKTYIWDGCFEAMRERDGQNMTILRPAIVPDEADAEVGPMFLAEFEDGFTQFVYSDEIGN